MVKKKKPTGGPGGQRLLTLSEIAKRTGISMSTLMRYKKEHQREIPSEGKGRKQRYPTEAISVFRKIYKSGRKQGGRKSSKQKNAAARGTGSNGDLLSLAAIQRETGISYPTLLRYVKNHGDKIPSKGTGRNRRYPREAVAIFKQLRKHRGRLPEGAAKKSRSAGGGGPRTASVRDESMSQRIRELESAQQSISQQLQEIIDTLRRPLQVTIEGQ